MKKTFLKGLIATSLLAHNFSYGINLKRLMDTTAPVDQTIYIRRPSPLPAKQLNRQSVIDTQASDTQGSDKQASYTQASDKQGDDKQGDDKQASDKQGDDKQGDDKQGDDKQASDKQASDTQGSDKQAPDKQASDKQAPDKQAPDKKASDKQGNDKQGDDKNDQEKDKHATIEVEQHENHPVDILPPINIQSNEFINIYPPEENNKDQKKYKKILLIRSDNSDKLKIPVSSQGKIFCIDMGDIIRSNKYWKNYEFEDKLKSLPSGELYLQLINVPSSSNNLSTYYIFDQFPYYLSPDVLGLTLAFEYDNDDLDSKDLEFLVHSLSETDLTYFHLSYPKLPAMITAYDLSQALHSLSNTNITHLDLRNSNIGYYLPEDIRLILHGLVGTKVTTLSLGDNDYESLNSLKHKFQNINEGLSGLHGTNITNLIIDTNPHSRQTTTPYSKLFFKDLQRTKVSYVDLKTVGIALNFEDILNNIGSNVTGLSVRDDDFIRLSDVQLQSAMKTMESTNIKYLVLNNKKLCEKLARMSSFFNCMIIDNPGKKR
ncbi:hypothetical protein [Facilibium subflavum]|nr:hypothetical protein [Facilibium subflavum]